jgi:hypothetical protein
MGRSLGQSGFMYAGESLDAHDGLGVGIFGESNRRFRFKTTVDQPIKAARINLFDGTFGAGDRRPMQHNS